jgi:L-alanine-DL-glutamate epimerase-like enolase superfamily enzyme
MKVGREPQCDAQRVASARAAIGPQISLFVDANGAYSRKQALDLAQRFAQSNVTWFEEPVSADDLPGLRLLRDRAPQACTSVRANMPGAPMTSAGFSSIRLSMCCRQMRHAAAVSRDF